MNLEMVTSTMSENKDTSQKCLIFVLLFLFGFQCIFFKKREILIQEIFKNNE